MHHVNRLAVILAAALPLLLSGPVMAQATEDERILEQQPAGGTDQPPPAPTEDDELDEQVFYSGMGVDRVSTDFDNLGEAINLDLVIGFRIPTLKWFGIEIDIGQTIIPGEYRDPLPGQAATPSCTPIPTANCGQPARPAEVGADDREGDEFAMQALGLSAAFKSTGRFYVMGKYGYRYIATSNDTINEKRSGNGFGAGVGYRWGKGLSGVEFSYKELAENVEALGLTFYARFNR